MVKRIIPVNFWSQRSVLEEYTLEERLFHLYLLTNQYTTQIGIYPLHQSYICLETGLNQETIQHLLTRFEAELGLIRYDPETQEVAMLTSLEFSIMRGGKPVLDLLRREIQRIKATPLILSTYEAMCPFWRYSKRPFDQQIQALFEDELASREVSGFEDHTVLLESESKSKSNSIHNNIHNQTHNQIHNHNHNHNQDSYHDSSARLTQKANQAWQDTLDAEEQQLLNYYEQAIGEVSYLRFQALSAYLAKMTVEVIQEAIGRSTKARHPYKYCLTILDNWTQQDIQHIGDLIQHEKHPSDTTASLSRLSSGTPPVITPDWLLAQS